MDTESRLENGVVKGEYELSGKILLSAIAVLLTVVLFIVGLHLYARCYALRLRRRQLERRRLRLHHHRSHIVFHTDTASSINQGLEPAVLNSLPVFVYSSKTHPDMLECAVCLSEFEEKESARLLPKCNHSFHIECIDMWFHSHSTCPLCRSTVESVGQPETSPAEIVLNVEEPAGNGCEREPGSSSISELSVSCEDNENVNATSLGVRRKGLDMVGVTIEVPRITELELSSSSSHSLRSPVTRLLSFKRILSIKKKSPGGAGSRMPCEFEPSYDLSETTELDLEHGNTELTQDQSRVQTPR
ncbi:RING-H2 finger protein ATL2 [Abeliophyllum distichum]|uniref:RING-type E3 ubiquitin transferase n=1 Tax=Abeliophyllum distichum TaxID=126358 RepID=A0ABD1T2G0_9LAMI